MQEQRDGKEDLRLFAQGRVRLVSRRWSPSRPGPELGGQHGFYLSSPLLCQEDKEAVVSFCYGNGNPNQYPLSNLHSSEALVNRSPSCFE